MLGLLYASRSVIVAVSPFILLWKSYVPMRRLLLCRTYCEAIEQGLAKD